MDRWVYYNETAAEVLIIPNEPEWISPSYVLLGVLPLSESMTEMQVSIEARMALLGYPIPRFLKIGKRAC